MTSASPHIRDDNSPLDTLAMAALRQYGEGAPHTIEGDVILMFVEFANEIVEEVNAHPYREAATAIEHYTDPTEARAIADQIMIAGLKFYYAVQQTSPKANTLGPAYYKTLNRTLWNELNGNTSIRLRPVDDGSNERYINGGAASAVNGLVTDPTEDG